MRCLIAAVFLFLGLSIVSCDDDYPYDLQKCDCHDGNNNINGWGDKNDSSLNHNNDTIGGFAISVDEWGNPENQDIQL